MKNQIWLPDSETRVVIENGEVKVWEQIIMIKENLNKSTFGFEKEKEDEE